MALTNLRKLSVRKTGVFNMCSWLNAGRARLWAEPSPSPYHLQTLLFVIWIVIEEKEQKQILCLYIVYICISSSKQGLFFFFQSKATFHSNIGFKCSQSPSWVSAAQGTQLFSISQIVLVPHRVSTLLCSLIGSHPLLI